MMDEGHTVDVIYLDFAKAIDSINGLVVFAKTKSFNFGDIAVQGIEVSLTARVSTEHINLELWGTISMRIGVQQVSAKGPLFSKW